MALRPSVVDTNTNCTPHVAELRDRGVTHIGRYYASSAWKRLTKTEAVALSEAGFQLFTVFEDSGDPELTFDRGAHDAQIALSQAKAVGQPEGSAIYFALEHLPHGYEASHLPGIKRYVSGIKRVLGDAYKIGVYSDGVVLDALLEGALIDYAWLSASTSFAGSKGFDKARRWHLAQRKVDLNWGRVSVDTNDAVEEFGAFTLKPSAEVVSLPVGGLQETTQHEAAHASADEPEHMVIPAADPPKEEQASYWDRFSFAQLNELADQGSRVAGWIRSIKRWFWGGATATAGGASALMQSNGGTRNALETLIMDHPFLFVAVVLGVAAVVAYAAIKVVERYLLTAARSGRYSPRGS